MVQAHTSGRATTIELWFFDGCPNWRIAYSRLRTAVAAEGLDVVIELRDLARESIAPVAGSPSFVSASRDLFPDLGAATAPALSCRVYKTPEGLAGSPTESQLRQVLAGISH